MTGFVADGLFVGFLFGEQAHFSLDGVAFQFTQKGSVELIVHFGAGYLTFKVKDTGRGISESQAQELFQPFTQADISTTRKFGGTGLGLVLTKKLCEAMGGDFWLESSTLGVGSVFAARVKVSAPIDCKMIRGSEFKFTTEPNVKKLAQDPELTGARILVVEDSPDNRLLIKVVLSRHGAKIVFANDGIEGVEKALADRYDVVIMDVQMPRMDGYEAVRELRSRGYDRPIIALTAHAMKEEREKCMNVGFSEFLSKPINQESLISTVKNLL
ncbi:MAG: response regulator [Proteobacteria bacterium]|nr:MAG: response regulator [Pseudomonadota bacterium]